MKPEPSESGQEDTVFNEILAEYFEAVEQGSVLDRDAFKTRHPRHAERLEEFFSDQQRFAERAEPHTREPHTRGHSTLLTCSGDFAT